MTTGPIYVGQTFRVTVSNLTDAGGTALVSPAVTITLVDPGGVETAGTVVADGGGAYHADFAATRPGLHKIVAEAMAGGGTWVGKTTVTINP